MCLPPAPPPTAPRTTPAQVQDTSRGNQVLGFAMLHMAASKDGCTLFWTLGRRAAPLAIRWQPGLGPWKVGRFVCIAGQPLYIPECILPTRIICINKPSSDPSAPSYPYPTFVCGGVWGSLFAYLGPPPLINPATPFFTPPPITQVKVPLEGCPSCPRASITLSLSTDPWVYQQELVTSSSSWGVFAGAIRTPGPRTLVLQVLEGGGVLGKPRY